MISIIVPSYNSQSTIINCIRSLKDQKIEKPFEILVINSSNDKTQKIVKEQFPTVNFTQLNKRVFASAARNRGIQEAKGDILAFIDADCTVPSNWLSQICSWHRKGYRAVGGSLANASPKNIYSKAEYPLEILEFSPNNPKKETKFVSAANCSFKREIFNEHGRFPNIRAGEDLIYCYKIAKKGERIIFDPNINAFHKNDIHFRQYLKKQIMHGQHSYEIRQMENLPGSLINHPIILPFLLPVLPFIRSMRIIFRSLYLKNHLIFDIIQTFPLFFLGCVLWSFGYAKGYSTQILKKERLPGQYTKYY